MQKYCFRPFISARYIWGLRWLKEIVIGLKMKSSGTQVNTGVSGNTSTNPRSRSWFITVNNYTDKDIEECLNHDCVYITWQKEIGEECGTPHIHIYVHYKNPRVWPKKSWPTAHIENVKNNNECIKYCQKEETRVDGPWERGTKPEPGRRTDLESTARKLIEGKSLRDIAIENPDHFVRYTRGLQALKEILQTDRDKNNPPIVTWIYGLAGKGKSRHAIELHEHSYYLKDGTQWWNGYSQEEAIIIDDFDGRWPYRDLLRLLDRYPYQGQTKGGYVKINSPYIYVTCEHPPEYFWSGNEYEQVARRITERIEMN